MWIILTKKLPTKPSPPKLSIHWTMSDVWESQLQAQKEMYFNKYTGKCQDWGGEYDPGDLPDYFLDGIGRADPNVEDCVKIHYKGSDLRVLKHEYNTLDHQRMRDYVFGIELSLCSIYQHRIGHETLLL